MRRTKSASASSTTFNRPRPLRSAARKAESDPPRFTLVSNAAARAGRPPDAPQDSGVLAASFGALAIMFRTLMRSRRLLRTLWRLLFRLEVVGRENLASAEAPNLITVDHVSWLDAAILFSIMETPATFVIEPAAAKSWPQRFFLRSSSRRSRFWAPARPIMWRWPRRSATSERNRGSRISPRANGRLVSTAPPCEVCNRQ